MNARAEPTQPGRPAEKPSQLRVALLSAVALILGAHTLLSERGTAASQEISHYQTANSLLKEVHEGVAKTTCHFGDNAAALVRLKELPDLIPAWRQTARIEPSELLRSLERIAETTNCPAVKTAPKIEVEKLRDDLEKQLEQDVRSLFARLRKAEREGDRESASRNVSELQELLQHHHGPLRQHLDRLARLYQGK